MNIYIIRHGDAEEISKGVKDFDRKLTSEGELEMKAAAKNLKKIIPSIDHIVSSPYLRAVQTAKIIGSEYGLSDKVETSKKLSGGSKTEDLIEIANSLEAENVAFVGHEPDCSNHISNLISASGVFIKMRKGAAAKIIFSNKAAISKGILEFLIPPVIFKNEL